MTRDKPRDPNYIQDLFFSNMIINAELAQNIGELLLVHHYGGDQMKLQKPFAVDDQDDQWVVRGSRNKDRKEEGFGAARIIIRKKDGAILDMYVPLIMHPHPDVRPILEKARKVRLKRP